MKELLKEPYETRLKIKRDRYAKVLQDKFYDELEDWGYASLKDDIDKLVEAEMQAETEAYKIGKNSAIETPDDIINGELEDIGYLPVGTAKPDSWGITDRMPENKQIVLIWPNNSEWPIVAKWWGNYFEDSKQACYDREDYAWLPIPDKK